jgi:chromosome segregation ATPase
MDYNNLTKIWDDFDQFVLPEMSSDLKVSASRIEQALSEVYNYYAYLSEFEPEYKQNIVNFEIEIQRIDDKINNLVLDGLTRFDEIPVDHQKNKERVHAWVVRKMYRSEIDKLKEKKKDLQNNLNEIRIRYDRLLRKLKTASKMMENARTILSTIKVEMNNI